MVTGTFCVGSGVPVTTGVGEGFGATIVCFGGTVLVTTTRPGVDLGVCAIPAQTNIVNTSEAVIMLCLIDRGLESVLESWVLVGIVRTQRKQGLDSLTPAGVVKDLLKKLLVLQLFLIATKGCSSTTAKV